MEISVSKEVTNMVALPGQIVNLKNVMLEFVNAETKSLASKIITIAAYLRIQLAQKMVKV